VCIGDPSQRSLVEPPLRAVPPLNCLIATVQDHDDPELKLKRIAPGKGPVEHVDGMMKREML